MIVFQTLNVLGVFKLNNKFDILTFQKSLNYHLPMDASEPIYKLLGNQIRAQRRRREMSQLELGHALGISRPSVANMEAGRQRVPLHLLYRLARVLGTEPAALLPPVDQAIPEESSAEEDITQFPPNAREFTRIILEKENIEVAHARPPADQP